MGESKRYKKIALLGGSFNPIHDDHKSIARACYEKYGFDEVWILPNYQNPLKQKQEVSINQKLTMINMMIKDLEYASICDLEIMSQKTTYTYDTVCLLRQKFPDFRFSFIIGSDILEQLNLWKNINQLKKLVTFYCFVRNNKYNQEIADKYNIKKCTFNSLYLSSTDLRKGINMNLLNPKLNKFIIFSKIYAEERLNELMEPKRRIHCLNVGAMAKKLAIQHCIDPVKAEVAGYLHDITKRFTNEQHYFYINKYFPELVNEPLPTLHALSAYGFLKDKWNLQDSLILQAIVNHTCASTADMSLFDKIIFVSDKISEERSYVDVDYYRTLAFKDIELCFKMLLKKQYKISVSKHGKDNIGQKLVASYKYWIINQP